MTWDREGGRSRTPKSMLGTEACWLELGVLHHRASWDCQAT